MPYCFSSSREAKSRWQSGKNNITDRWSLTLRGERKKPGADDFVLALPSLGQQTALRTSRLPPLGFTSASHVLLVRLALDFAVSYLACRRTPCQASSARFVYLRWWSSPSSATCFPPCSAPKCFSEASRWHLLDCSYLRSGSPPNQVLN